MSNPEEQYEGAEEAQQEETELSEEDLEDAAGGSVTPIEDWLKPSPTFPKGPILEAN